MLSRSFTDGRRVELSDVGRPAIKDLTSYAHAYTREHDIVSNLLRLGWRKLMSWIALRGEATHQRAREADALSIDRVMSFITLLPLLLAVSVALMGPMNNIRSTRVRCWCVQWRPW